MKLQYWVVDAFTDRLFAGNPAAVLLPGRALPTALMQSIAAENNLSETAFATPEGERGLWRLRWFTPTTVVDLCGHATLATSFVLANQGHGSPFRFATRSGILTATIAGDAIELDFPARPSKQISAPPGLADALGEAAVETLQSADLVAVLGSAAEIAELRPDSAKIAALPGGAVIVTAAGGIDGADITSRYFAPAYGIAEDPVTGSLHTQVVPYWAQKLGRNTLVCHQASARGGVLHCTLDGDRVRIGGTAVLYANGHIFVPGEHG